MDIEQEDEKGKCTSSRCYEAEIPMYNRVADQSVVANVSRYSYGNIGEAKGLTSSRV